MRRRRGGFLQSYGYLIDRLAGTLACQESVGVGCAENATSEHHLERLVLRDVDSSGYHMSQSRKLMLAAHLTASSFESKCLQPPSTLLIVHIV